PAGLRRERPVLGAHTPLRLVGSRLPRSRPSARRLVCQRSRTQSEEATMSKTVKPLVLTALDGANPLGFLASLGALAVLSETDVNTRLGWQAGARWTPFLQSGQPLDEASLATRLAEKLCGKPVDAAAEQKRGAAQKRFDTAKKQLKDAEAALKKRKLRGAE